MKVIYIAGPFRPKQQGNYWQQEQNIRKAEELALQVWRANAAAICPHANTRFYQGCLPDDVWLEGDLAILEKCDAVLLTHNWAQSTGTRAEVAFAREHKIPVFHSLAELIRWLNEAR